MVGDLKKKKKKANLLETMKLIFISTSFITRGAILLPTEHLFLHSPCKGSCFSGKQPISYSELCYFNYVKVSNLKYSGDQSKTTIQTYPKKISRRTAVYFTPNCFTVLVKYFSQSTETTGDTMIIYRRKKIQATQTRSV